MDELENGVTESVADSETQEPEVTEASNDAVNLNEEPAQEAEQEAEQKSDPAQEIPNAVWAAARRRAEQEAQARIDRQFAAKYAGYTNPTTKAPIKSAKDYWDAVDAQQEIARQRAVEQATANLDAKQKSALQAAMRNDPEKARMRSELDEIKRSMAERDALAAFNNDFAQLTQLDPNIKTIDDLAKTEGFDEIVRLVKGDRPGTGMDMVSAYKVVNYGRAAQASAQAGRQAAINAVRGKNHLAAHGGSADGDSQKAIPEKMLNVLKTQFPGKSTAELTKLYNQTL